MKYSLLALLIITALATACQKDISGGDPPPGPGPGDKKLVTKYIYTHGKQTWTDTFSYDQQNRCTRIDQVYIDSSSSAPYPYLWFTSYHYNGNDQLPYKITDTSEGRDMNWYLLFDSQKRKILDSVIYLDGEKFIVKYNYTGNRVISNTTYTSSSGTITTQSDTMDSDGANWVRYAYQSSAPYQLKITYDNHPNPFTLLNVASFISQYGITSVGDFTQCSKNNSLKVEYYNSGSSVPLGTVNYQYVYNADGFPASSAITSTTSPAEIDREKFIYNK